MSQILPARVAMTNLTCVVDATTLIDKINEIKQWVYQDHIRLYVPLCTFESVELLFKASIKPKETQKETSSKKPAKGPRKEYPLFDINPRIAREFLLRAQSGQDDHGVIFQSLEAEFTQWKPGKEQPVQIEKTPDAPPSTFAQALLRKLNINDGSDMNDPKGSSKPKLVARSPSPKSPWKHHKVPTISTAGVPANLKAFFSSALWRVHEFENNPLSPETCVVLTDNAKIAEVAQNLGLPLRQSLAIHQWLHEKRASEDHRATKGELEEEFASKVDLKVEESIDHVSEIVPKVNTTDFGFETLLEEDDELEEIRNSVISQNLSNGNVGKATQKSVAPDLENNNKDIKPMTNISVAKVVDDIHLTTEPSVKSCGLEQENCEITPNLGSGPYVQQPITPLPSTTIGKVDHVSKDLAKISSEKINGKHVQANISSDEESDDDVIVFNPKARRFSGQPKATSSQPKSIDISTQAGNILSAENVNPKQPMMLAPPRVISALRPDSPVFTPAQTATVIQPEVQSLNAVMESKESPDTPPQTIRQQRQARPTAPRQPRTINQNKNSSHEFVQRQSRDILQRQREAIQRKTQGAVSKTSPRKVQIEQTSNPTVIDPDAFDRSYIVQPPVNNQKEKLGHQGANNPNKRNSNGHGHGNRRLSPRGSPKRERAGRVSEPDVDFVLKSGTPRESTRGKGKLWVP